MTVQPDHLMCSTEMQKSVQAERRLILVFLYGLPLLLEMYTAEKLVVVRGSIKVRKMLQHVRYKEYCTAAVKSLYPRPVLAWQNNSCATTAQSDWRYGQGGLVHHRTRV